MLTLVFPARHSRRCSRRRSSRLSLTRLLKYNVRPWNIICFTLLTILTIGYLALTNENATAGYELRALEGRMGSLREEVRQLELVSLEAQSIDQLSSRVAQQDFVPMAHVEYLQTIDHAVAQR